MKYWSVFVTLYTVEGFTNTDLYFGKKGKRCCHEHACNDMAR